MYIVGNGSVWHGCRQGLIVSPWKHEEIKKKLPKEESENYSRLNPVKTKTKRVLAHENIGGRGKDFLRFYFLNEDTKKKDFQNMGVRIFFRFFVNQDTKTNFF